MGNSTSRQCEACRSIAEVHKHTVNAFHENERDVWLCNSCARHPKHVEVCDACRVGPRALPDEGTESGR